FDYHQAQQQKSPENQADADRRKQVSAGLGLNALVGRLKLRAGRLKLRLEVVSRGVCARSYIAATSAATGTLRSGIRVIWQLSHLDLEELGFLLLERVVDRIN